MSFGNSQVDVQCPHCHLTFFVPVSMKGGLANCPDCQKAVPVRDGFEPLFWLSIAGGVVLSLFLVVIASLVYGFIGGGIVLGICVALFALVLSFT